MTPNQDDDIEILIDDLAACWKCHNKLLQKRIRKYDQIVCDGCNEKFPPNVIYFHCDGYCDFDLCVRCASSKRTSSKRTSSKQTSSRNTEHIKFLHSFVKMLQQQIARLQAEKRELVNRKTHARQIVAQTCLNDVILYEVEWQNTVEIADNLDASIIAQWHRKQHQQMTTN